jgi:hypothetical protein
LKPKLIVLNLLLAAGVFTVVWQARVRVQLAHAERQANLNVRIATVKPPSVTAVPKPDAPAAVMYAEVANKNLFAADRNPTVVIDPPKVEAPKPMPALPVVYGTMGLPSGTKAIMAQKAGDPSKSVRTGDTIGDFKVVALNSEKVTFEWEGKQVEKRIEDLIDRSNTPTAAGVNRGPAAPAAPAAVAASPGRGPGDGSNGAAASGRPGAELSPTERACSGDAAPTGSVVDGYRKQFTPSPFGAINCRWIKQ